MTGRSSCELDCMSNASGQRDVVILDQYPVIQTEPMISAAADGYRIFFEHPKPRCRLACVHNLSTGAGNAIHKFPGQSGHGGESLKKIQSGSFAVKNHRCHTVNTGKFPSLCYPATIVGAGLDLERFI